MSGESAEAAKAAPAIDTLIIDAGPIIKSSMQLLRSKCRTMMTTQSVVDEIRDAQARQSFELQRAAAGDCFVVTRPNSESIAFVKQFARKTGDLQVLSTTDLELLALCYEQECLLNNGDWRLRREPGQKHMNGTPPGKSTDGNEEKGTGKDGLNKQDEEISKVNEAASNKTSNADEEDEDKEERCDTEQGQQADDDTATDSGDEWITPSNVEKYKRRDRYGGEAETGHERAVMKAAIATTDFAMQNVSLQIGLNLVSVEGAEQISKVKTWVLRCHACFKITRDMSRRFCPSCGNATLLRTSVSTGRDGVFRVHLKQNMEWHTRGNVYSLPKPRAGQSNQKGQKNPILSADQLEYQRAQKQSAWENKASRAGVDISDPDWMPGMVTGARSHSTRIQLGMGRDPNRVRRKK